MAAPAVLLIGALALTACSSSTSSGSTSSPAASESAASDLVGGDPSTWSPQEIAPGASTVTEGQFLILGGLAAIQASEQLRVDSSNEQVIYVSQSGPGAYAMVNALAAGTSTVNVYVVEDAATGIPASEKPVATYDFTVEPYGAATPSASPSASETPLMGSDPSTWSPVVIDMNDTEVTLTDHQFAVVDTSPVVFDSSVNIATSDAGIVDVVDQSREDYGLIQANSSGSTVLTVTDANGTIMVVKVNVKPLPKGIADSP